MLNAFCIDHFANVSREFTNGLTRTDKINLLLEYAAPTLVLQRLAEFCADANVPILFQQIVDRLPIADTKASALRAELEQLYIQRGERTLDQEGTADLDARIVQLKRAQREGQQLKEGDLLGDRYWLQRLLGKGGFAKVWQAFDRTERRFVALKVLHSEFSEDPRRLERFGRGVTKLRGIHHPHVVAVYSNIEQDSGTCFMAMEYLPGGDLHQSIIQHRISRQEGLCAVLQVCGALSLMHREGMIHRDVKPQNILLTGDGIAKLADFDLVWAADTTGGTKTGSLGTFLYAAPEAMVDASDATCRADVYSLAMTVLFVLHGQPLPANIHFTLSRFIEQLDAPTKLKAILSQATHLDPSRRIASIDALRSALRQAASRFLERLDEPTGPVTTRPPDEEMIARRTLMQAGTGKGSTSTILLGFLSDTNKRIPYFAALGSGLLLGAIGLTAVSIRSSGTAKLIDKALDSYNTGTKNFTAAHYDTARKDFEAALQLAPDSQELKHYLEVCDSEETFHEILEQAKKQLDDRKYAEALKLFDKIDKTSTQYEDAQQQARAARHEAIRAIYNEASALARNDNAAALEKVGQGLEYDPESADLLELENRLRNPPKPDETPQVADNTRPLKPKKPESKKSEPASGEFSKAMASYKSKDFAGAISAAMAVKSPSSAWHKSPCRRLSSTPRSRAAKPARPATEAPRAC